MNFIRRLLIFICIVGCIASGLLWYWPNISKAQKKAEPNYKITVFAKDQESAGKIKGLLKEKGFEASEAKAMRHFQKKSGYRVVFRMDDKKLLKGLVGTLKGKNVKAVLIEDKDTGESLLMAGGIFNQKAPADKLAKKISNMTMIDFKVEDNFKKTPYNAIILTIEKVEGDTASQELQELLTPLSSETIKVEELPAENPDSKETVPTEDKKEEKPEKSASEKLEEKSSK